MAIDAALVGRLNDELTADLDRNGRLGLVRRYLAGDHDMPYMPRGAKSEYRHLAERAVTNWLPLVSDTYAKGLFVDGYRPDRSAENAEAWTYWQANGLDARQSIAHRGALEYGTSYCLILPGKHGSRSMPFWRPLSPLRAAAWYRDEDDEFPEIAIRRRGCTADGVELLEAYDNTARYTFAKPPARPGEEATWRLSATDEHGLGVTPIVRFRDRLDCEAEGIIRPLIGQQNQINESVFNILIAMQFASFRQRWATGLAIPFDDDGKPIEPFQAAINRLWVTPDAEARFGDFAQTDISGHLQEYQVAVRTMAAIAQINPGAFTGDLINLSSDALAQLEATTQRKLAEYETIFGESWESAFRLAAVAAGNPRAASTNAQVRWRDTEARALAASVDAAGKMVAMLGVPQEAAWEMLPGVTDEDIQRWRALREQQQDVLSQLIGDAERQLAANPQNVAAVTGEAGPAQ